MRSREDAWWKTEEGRKRHKQILRESLEKHNRLKAKAAKTLVEKGFKQKEVKQEFTVYVPVSEDEKKIIMKKIEELEKKLRPRRFRVDVVGISSSRKVAVECGYTDSEKLEKLKEVFDEVYVLEYDGTWRKV